METVAVILAGLKDLRLAAWPNIRSAETARIPARDLLQPPDTITSEWRRSLGRLLKRVSLFEDLGDSDLMRVARIVREREYGDGEYICEEGCQGTALFVVRRGVVEVVKRGAGGQEISLALLEPPASFEEAAAIAAGVTRWSSVRARGPVSLLVLGTSDFDALRRHLPMIANKILIRLVGIMTRRLERIIDAEVLGVSLQPAERKP